MKIFGFLLVALLLNLALPQDQKELDKDELIAAEFDVVEGDFVHLIEDEHEDKESRHLGKCKTIYQPTKRIRRPRYLFHNGVQYRTFKATCKEDYNKIESYEVDWSGDCRYDTEDCSQPFSHTVQCRLGVSRERDGCKVKYVNAALVVRCCK